MGNITMNSELGGIPPATPSLADHMNSNVNLSMMENMGYDGAVESLQQHHIDHEPAIPAIGSVMPNTPWGGEDYDFPPSVGPAEEQATDETYEQYEERVLNKRAVQMYHIVKSKLEVDSTIPFSTMCNQRNTRKQVAQKFYTLLVLKKHQAVELTQVSSYASIVVSRGPKFDSAELSL